MASLSENHMKQMKKELLWGVWAHENENIRLCHFENDEIRAEMPFLLSCHLYAKLNTLKEKYTSPEFLTFHGYVHRFFSTIWFDAYL